MMSDFPCCDNGEHHRVKIFDRMPTGGTAYQKPADMAPETRENQRDERDRRIEKALELIDHHVEQFNTVGSSTPNGGLWAIRAALTAPVSPGTQQPTDARALLEQYAAEDPSDGDYGCTTREAITPEGIAALRAVLVIWEKHVPEPEVRQACACSLCEAVRAIGRALLKAEGRR